MSENLSLRVGGDRLRDLVYDALRGDLRNGRFAPGERLVEHTLARELEVSRTPVREALFQLARDGLLESSERGYRAPALGDRDIRELYEMRLLLDPEIARLAARHIDHDGLLSVFAAVAAEREAMAAGDLGAFVEANIEFRHALAAPCPNRRLTAATALIDDQLRVVMNLTLADPANQAITIAQHRRAADAIKRGDGERAANAVRESLYIALEYQRRGAASPSAADPIAYNIDESHTLPAKTVSGRDDS